MALSEQPSLTPARTTFGFGQIVCHRLFSYRGVIIGVDASFSGSDAWYAQMAKTRPPREAPWYHVLVDGSEHATYVAERNLAACTSGEPVMHPELDRYFDEHEKGRYISHLLVH